MTREQPAKSRLVSKWRERHICEHAVRVCTGERRRGTAFLVEFSQMPDYSYRRRVRERIPTEG